MIIEQALCQIAFTRAFDDFERRKLADYVGVDISEWQVTESWLQKKTKFEIIQWIASSGMMRETSFLLYLRKKYNLIEIQVFDKMKKSEIVEAIIKSCLLYTSPSPRD